MPKKLDWKELLGWSTQDTQRMRVEGYLYLRQGKYEIATTFFKALSILEPQNAYDQQTLGSLYLQEGKGREALECLNRALALAPNHPLTLLNRARTLILLGRKEEALEAARRLQTQAKGPLADQAAALVMAYAPIRKKKSTATNPQK